MISESPERTRTALSAIARPFFSLRTPPKIKFEEIIRATMVVETKEVIIGNQRCFHPSLPTLARAALPREEEEEEKIIMADEP